MLDSRAIRRKKPAFFFPIIPLSFVFTYQYDLGYGTLLQRMKVLQETTPRTEAIWANMPHLHLSHLLKVWLLLLSQLPRGIPAQNDDKIIKACSRELVRLRIRICGSVSWGERAHQQVREPRQASEPLAEVLPSSIIHTKTLNTTVEHIPNLSQELKAALSDRQPSIRELRLDMESSNLNLEELKKAVLSGQNEAEDKRLSELENSGLDKHSRKKRQSYVHLSDKCCNLGCTRKELAALC
ncbi:prorelaxin isoform X3 [Enhydra lutris kenyoni]|uniref:Prorelaxin isoform X3 n=1 Tax=Enhydra lutris kenyoni TaxID=391180 RepID=A0A2Y9KA33_ENHLU|nr:prorelaxin isoform X3 [Enhydra lutris kenyoni]